MYEPTVVDFILNARDFIIHNIGYFLLDCENRVCIAFNVTEDGTVLGKETRTGRIPLLSCVLNHYYQSRRRPFAKLKVRPI